jgi:hypothetical protein
VIAADEDGRRAFVYEYTEAARQPIVLSNLANSQQKSILRIYKADGSVWGEREVTVRGMESVEINPSAEWQLPTVAEGTPGAATGYGVVVDGSHLVSVIAASDNVTGKESRVGSIAPQWLGADDSWWGMRNDPSSGDAIHLFNPNEKDAKATFTVYDANGKKAAAAVAIELKAFQTVRLSTAMLNVPAELRDIGIHMESSRPLAVNIATALGSDWDPVDGRYTTYDRVSGVFVPQDAEVDTTAYLWENAQASGKMSSARVTNISRRAATVKMTVFVFDGQGARDDSISYEVVVEIPGRGTREMPLPREPEFAAEPVSSNAAADRGRDFHLVVLRSDRKVAVHTAFTTGVEVPQLGIEGRREYLWGAHAVAPGRAFTMINPHNREVEVTPEAWHWQEGGVERRHHERGDVITLGPYDTYTATLSELVDLSSSDDSTLSNGPDRLMRLSSPDTFAFQAHSNDIGDVRLNTFRDPFITPFWPGLGIPGVAAAASQGTESSDGETITRTFTQGVTTVSVITQTTDGSLIKSAVTVNVTDLRGILVWQEIYIYEPTEGTIITATEVETLITELLANPVLHNSRLDLEIDLVQQDIIWDEDSTPPGILDPPASEPVSPDGS